MKYLLPNFSHIYIEKDADGYPLTALAQSKFPDATMIFIDSYKDVFNRSRQDFQVQKKSMKLILSKKRGTLLYPASDMIQEYDNPNTFYNTPVLNCLYNCDYCFLQGMYNSGNLVVFVNEEDFMDAVDKQLLKPKDPLKPTIVSISYNTDLLAIENIFSLARNWINFAKTKPDLIIEIRTKSTLFSTIKDIEPSDNIILSWTLSPENICNQYETTAPSLNRRLKAVNSAATLGWNIRLCFDPVLLMDDWYFQYSQLLKHTFSEVDVEKIRDITFGVFRMNKDYFNRIRKRESTSLLYYGDYTLEGNTIVVGKEKRKKALSKLKNIASKYINNDKILIWQ